MRARRYSAKLVVLKTLSSTGLEQSIAKECETLVSVASFLMVLVLLYLTTGSADFVAIRLFI